MLMATIPASLRGLSIGYDSSELQKPLHGHRNHIFLEVNCSAYYNGLSVSLAISIKLLSNPNQGLVPHGPLQGGTYQPLTKKDQHIQVLFKPLYLLPHLYSTRMGSWMTVREVLGHLSDEPLDRVRAVYLDAPNPSLTYNTGPDPSSDSAPSSSLLFPPADQVMAAQAPQRSLTTFWDGVRPY
ncbi:hypothetical protein PtB15_11B223 [Puccinia triticina]|nr:hypothetical protein PtB15_11B223 [Puccinia triticina]